jgi:DNA-binding FadR family transcriptional regulator
VRDPGAGIDGARIHSATAMEGTMMQTDRFSLPLRGDALHDAIKEQIKRIIVERGLQTGDPLPTEAELVRILGVSRNTLREAIRSLQTLGMVAVRHGHGTFVGDFSMDPLVDGLTFRILSDMKRSIRTVHELLELRQVIESGLITRVVGQLTAEDLAELRQLVAGMEMRAMHGEAAPIEDRAFHEALYRPLENGLVIQLLQAFWDVFRSVRDKLPGIPPPLTVTAAQHREILDAVESRDPITAAQAMTEHFRGIQAWIGDSPTERAEMVSG